MEKSLGKRAMQTREHILAQGMELMKERGFSSTTIRDICEATEVSVGTFYAYFKGKGDLFRYNFQHQDTAFADFLDESLQGDTAEERILSFVRYYAWLNIGTEPKELERIFLRPDAHWYPADNPAFHVLYAVVVQGQESGELTGSIDANLIVDMLRVFLRGCVYEWIMGGFVYDLEERMLSYVGQFVKSFRASGMPPTSQ